VSRSALKAALLGLALTFAIAAPASAFAAKAPAAGGTLDTQAWPENGTLVVVTALTIPETTKLPATVRIPVPSGAQIQWAGEVLGGDPAADPGREYAIKKSPAGGEYAEFTAETTRSVQLDSYLSVVKTEGARVSAQFDWVQSVTAPSETFSMRVPKGATNVELAPKPSGDAETNDAGETLFSGDTMTLDAGSTTLVSIAYTTGGAAPAAPAAGGSGRSLLYFIFATLVVVAGVLLVVIVKQRERGRVADDGAAARSATRTRERSKRTEASAGAADADVGEADDDGDSADWGFIDSDE